MSNDRDDEHFKEFALALEGVIAKYGTIEDLYALQREQLTTLIGLEAEFRSVLQASKYGLTIYTDFVDYICNVKKNILDARPFFRERQKLFTKEISGVFKAKEPEKLYGFRFNYRFVLFVMDCRHWGKNSEIRKLFNKISALRTEIIEINTPLAISRARVFYSRTPKSHLSYMDLIQIAIEGLMSGIDKYTPDSTGGIIPRIFRSTVLGRIGGNHIENYCLDQDTILNPVGQKPKKLKDFRSGDKILGVDSAGQVIKTEVVSLHDHGVIEGFEITFDDGYKVVCSANHKFLTKNGMVKLCDIVNQKLEIFCGPPQQNRRLGVPLWDNVPNQTKTICPHDSVRYLQEIDCGSTQEQCSESDRKISFWQGCENLDQHVWNTFQQAPPFLRSSKGLRSLCNRNQDQAQNALNALASGKSGETSGKSQKGFSGVYSMEEGQSRTGGVAERTDFSRYGEMAPSQSRTKCSDCSQHAPCSETKGIASGTSFKRTRNPSLADDTNSVWKQEHGTQRSGLCFSRSQDLGGSGRILAFQYSQEYGASNRAASLSTVEGRDVKSRSDEKTGRYVDTFIGELLFEKSRKGNYKGTVERLAYKYAPLASTGDLVLRKVVRVRSVGPKRMYDLEVAHPKHNFLLPNGVVTSNSETQIHFYPVDKRKIYRANKVIRRFTDGVDYNELAIAVNIDVDGAHQTNSGEIADLMAAASCLSLDQRPSSTEEVKDKNLVGQWDIAPETARPDVQFETDEANFVLQTALYKLSIFEQKFLRMKGIVFNVGGSR